MMREDGFGCIFIPDGNENRGSAPPSKYPNAQKDQSERIGLFVAGLAEMNIRRVIERKTQSRSSNNALYLYVPRTFESENKGWSK